MAIERKKWKKSNCAVLRNSFSITSFANDINAEMLNKFRLKAQIRCFRKKLAQETTQNKKLFNKQLMKKELKNWKKTWYCFKTATSAKIQSGNDNLKWDVDFRTQVDNIQYKKQMVQKQK